jgi:ubiquitin-like-conjugating enzyme ATG3
MNLFNKLSELTTKTLQPLTNTSSFVNANITTVNRYLESFIPVSTVSQFISKGTLTPDEFVSAGNGVVEDLGWTWQSGIPSGNKPYLPEDKQFLFLSDIKTLPVGLETLTEHTDPESDTLLFHIAPEEGSPQAGSEFNDNILSVIEQILPEDKRTFEVSIVYDRYYRTPRVFLSGTNYEGKRLDPETVLSYVSPQHANKTITIELHPHLNELCVSIHPCMHPNAMKRFIHDFLQRQEEFHLKMYMPLFLQFVSCIVPTLLIKNTSNLRN